MPSVEPSPTTAAPAGPVPEIDVTSDLVRDLLRAQHPDLADLPLVPFASGWDNRMWRLGDALAVRLPVRAIAAPLVQNEQRWLPVLAPLLPVDTPVPVRTGRPGAGYPWAWSVVPWFAGTVAAATPVAERTPWATELADTFVALHVPAPPDAPVNPVRGVPLADRADVVRSRLTHLLVPEREALLARWDALVGSPVWQGPALWLHGDPHPANLLVADGHLRAVLDFGDVTAGDPASDLSTAWLTFDETGREAFRARVTAGAGWDEAMWLRAEAWAVAMAAVMLAHPEDHPLLAEVGRHAVSQILGR
ncbi:aminoglycoside phosphotransferase family protein [Cellulomonas soli]|uniref:Aminoglycoside phosphotransferase n=1 Tax=Cellulomonas soli TaxID=931535 RepID=A0A512P9W2_9CELL|nr:aminoglycoside phosphotransferase family protein [Cellulomonas soli]NYI60476.1 aminoglycoside phosphotransferase (APT) family kinase protein [Cellulomonas soli]GEP67991.1 aminoglycoside phosphotransferase [Cellulomonas soli]